MKRELQPTWLHIAFVISVQWTFQNNFKSVDKLLRLINAFRKYRYKYIDSRTNEERRNHITSIANTLSQQSTCILVSPYFSFQTVVLAWWNTRYHFNYHWSWRHVRFLLIIGLWWIGNNMQKRIGAFQDLFATKEKNLQGTININTLLKI